MSVGLISYNGVLLAVNGSLTVDPNCCCDVPPSECPPCCIRIDFGTFNEDGDLYGTFTGTNGIDEYTVNVTIIMPTKDSRFVCDEQNITVKWSIDPSDELPADGGYMRFGAGWQFLGEVPSVGVDGEVYDWGLVDWGQDFEGEEYEVTLGFRECFLDPSNFLFYIEIGLTSPEFMESIDVVRCPNPNLCCPEEIECEPCCALIVLEDAAKWNNKYYIVEEAIVDGDRYTTVMEIGNSNGRVCIGGPLDLQAYLVPPRHQPAGIAHSAFINFPTWTQTGFLPAINPLDGSVADEEIQWGTLTDHEYQIWLEAADCEGCELPEDIFQGVNFGSDVYPNVSISFVACDLTDCCKLIKCCPNPVPRVLIATFFDFGNCPCGDETEIELRFDDAEDAWIGTGDFCGNEMTLKLELECDPGDSVFDFRFLLTVESDCIIGEIVRATAAGQCDPIFQTSSFFLSPFFNDCCGAGDTSVQIIIKGNLDEPCDP